MGVELLTRRIRKRSSSQPERKINIVQVKRQRILSNDLLSCFSPKRYPCIFLDQRLRSRFFK